MRLHKLAKTAGIIVRWDGCSPRLLVPRTEQARATSTVLIVASVDLGEECRALAMQRFDALIRLDRERGGR